MGVLFKTTNSRLAQITEKTVANLALESKGTCVSGVYIYIYICVCVCVCVCVRLLYPHTCLAQGILSRRAVYPHFGVRTRLVFHAFRARVTFGIERVFGTGLAFCVIFIGPGD